MDSHSTSKTESPGGFWPVANMILGALIALFALYWGGVLVLGGVSASRKLRAPAAPEAPAVASPVPAAPAPVAAPAPAAPAATAVASSPAPSGPATEITIKPDPTNPLAYDTKSFTVKAGQKVKFTFNNTHPAVPQPHNWVLGKPGSKDKILAAAMGIMADPKALEKGYIPESSDILFHTKLLQPNASETIEFVAPAAGEYPYVCTFPGHGILMNGVMKVE